MTIFEHFDEDSREHDITVMLLNQKKLCNAINRLIILKAYEYKI